jgi:hypothetical protein
MRTWLAFPLVLLLFCSAEAQLISHPDGFLDAVYPAGGQVGQTIKCEFIGHAGLTGAKRVLVEGPPGVTVRDVVAKSHNLVEATLEIAPDAPLGRRLIRVAGGPAGLTNCRPFFVTRQTELLETEPNNTPDKATDVSIPSVINARLDKPLEVDCFRFTGKQGQLIVAAVTGYGMDSIIRKSFVLGYLDASLELLNESGQILAAAEDDLGLDPVLHCKLPADGQYVVRVKGVAYQGAASAIYRLTLGELPLVTSIYPAGGRRGETVDLEVTGINIVPGTKKSVAVDADPFLLQDVLFDDSAQCLKFIRGDLAESLEQEPNANAKQANPLALGSTANGRFETDGDEDWYAITLEAKQGVVFETLSQRHLRAPVDTLVRLYDESGKLLVEDDDGRLFIGQVWHDFEAADSRITFTAPAAGTYFVRVSNNSGVYGKQSIYRLTATPWLPDYQLFQWPDAVPIWGPGVTAACMVQAFTGGGLESDVEIRVEGLPGGWQGSVSNLPLGYTQPYTNTQIGGMALVTITSPANAEPGTIAPFRIFGRAKHKEQTIEHEAQYLTLYGNSHNDRMFLRYSRGAQAVVASPLDCRLETDVKELNVVQGQATEIPVRITRLGESTAEIGVSIDGPTVAAATGWRAPLTVAAGQSQATIPFPLNAEWKPGSYSIVVSRSWSADIRSGRPGPCTQPIRLNILPPPK